MAYKQKNNPVPITGCGRRRLSAMENPFKSQDVMSDESMSVEERVAKAQGREVGEMNRSSRFHPDNEGRKVKTAFNSKELRSVSKELKGAVKAHGKQAKKIDDYLKSSPAQFGIENKGMDSAARGTKAIGPDGKPLKMKSPIKAELKPCQKAAAKKKFKVYPSAYANMWASNHKC